MEVKVPVGISTKAAIPSLTAGLPPQAFLEQKM
jgi:hypothetical protein